MNVPTKSISTGGGGVATWHFLALGLALLTVGCSTIENYSLTYQVWDRGNLSNWSEPAPNPNLILSEAANGAEILVQYDSMSEKHSVVKRRAYYLFQNKDLIAAGKKPDFLDPMPAVGMQPIPELPGAAMVTPPQLEKPAYLISQDGRRFTLYRPEQPSATFDLPVYPETSGTVTRVALTPLAAAGDTVIVGVVAAVVGFIVWVWTGGPGLNH